MRICTSHGHDLGAYIQSRYTHSRIGNTRGAFSIRPKQNQVLGKERAALLQSLAVH